MRRFKNLKFHQIFNRKWLILVGICGFIFWVIWPIRFILNPNFLFRTHLLIFQNENEARPCGGFATAFGELRILPPKIVFKNTYHFLKNDFGKNEYPLSLVSEQKKFWDLGESANMAQCGKSFLDHYRLTTQQQIHSIILVNFSVLEDFLDRVGFVEIDGHRLNSKTLFSWISMAVADVDRHDENELAKRKTPLVLLAKKLIFSAFIKVHRWPEFTRFFNRKIRLGEIFIPNISPKIQPQNNDFSVIEWNLGGGKSSRYLQKNLKLDFREIFPDKWKITQNLNIKHLGGEDEPLSQTWKGVFEFQTPDFLGGGNLFVPAEILPGTDFSQNFTFDFSGKINDFSIFKPISQNINFDMTLSLFPQKTITTGNFYFHENIGTFSGTIDGFRKNFHWKFLEDKTAPFITLHEVVSRHVFESQTEKTQITNDVETKSAKEEFFVEIHFNELIVPTKDFSVVLEDRNFENGFSENPKLLGFKFLPNKKTVLLRFGESEYQRNERYFIKFFGIADLFKNPVAQQNRTLITR